MTTTSQILVTDYLKAYKATNCTSAVLELNTPISEQGFDSLDTIELVMAMEDDFEIEIPDKIAKQWVTPADVILAVAPMLKKE